MFFFRLFLLPFFFSFIGLLWGVTSLEAFEKPKETRTDEVSFSSLSLPPASGKKPESIVVLFHGYGDVGKNFLFLGALLGEFLPNTLFVAPDGPVSCKTIPSGKQWVKTSKNNHPQLLKEINTLTIALNQYVDNLSKEYHIPPEQIAFLGFSQGARIALHLGLRRPSCAGIVAMSGAYLNDPSAKNLLRPPILIIHGVEDQKAPVSLAKESFNQLDSLKMPVTLILLPGVAHDVDPQGLMIAGDFLKECLSGKSADK